MSLLENPKFSPLHYRYYLRKRLFGKNSIQAVSSQELNIHPEEKGYLSAALCLNNQKDKITGFHKESSPSIEKTRINGGSVVHRATKAWVIENALIKKWGIYKGAYHSRFRYVSKYDAAEILTDNTSRYVLSSSYTGVKYFGHWMTDDIPAYLLAEKMGTPISFPCFSNSDDKQFYSKAFAQNWNRIFLGKAKELIVLDDVGLNSGKIDRFRELRKRLKQKQKNKAKSSYVYIKRGVTGIHASQRVIKNENEVITFLESQGFLILDVKENTTQELADGLIDASLIVSLDGSHSYHALHSMSESGAWITIQPQDYFTGITNEIVDRLGIKFGFVVANRETEGLYVNIDELAGTIDLVLSQI